MFYLQQLRNRDNTVVNLWSIFNRGAVVCRGIRDTDGVAIHFGAGGFPGTGIYRSGIRLGPPMTPIIYRFGISPVPIAE